MSAVKKLKNQRPVMSAASVVGKRFEMILTLGLLFALVGCATVYKPEYELFWPPPPDTPRVKFEGVLRYQADLGSPGAGESIVRALLGPDRKRKRSELAWPMGIVTSKDGKRVYIADQASPAAIVFNLETRAVSFLGGEAAGLKAAFGIAVDEQENVYVVDGALKVVRVFSRDGKILGNITDKSLIRPLGIAIDAKRRRIYVSDTATSDSDHHVVAVFDMNGALLKTIGGKGESEGKFFSPTYLAVDDQGNLYVTDTSNARVQVFNPDGTYVRTIGARGDTFGTFDKPKGVALDTFGNIYVVDSMHGAVQVFNQKGELLVFFGSRGRIPGLFYSPTAIAIDSSNRIYVADPFESRVNIYQLINTKAEDSFPVVAQTPDKQGAAQSEGPKSPQPREAKQKAADGDSGKQKSGNAGQGGQTGSPRP